MAKSDFFCGWNAFFFGSRFYSAVLFSQVPKKCTDLDLSLFYNLISGTYSKFAHKNNFLALCARRSHRRAALLRTLRWLSKFSKKIRLGVGKSKSGSWNDEFSDNVNFPIRHHKLFLLRSRWWKSLRLRSKCCEFLGTRPDSIDLVRSHSFALE